MDQILGKRLKTLRADRYLGEVGYPDLDKGRAILEKILKHLPDDIANRFEKHCDAARIRNP